MPLRVAMAQTLVVDGDLSGNMRRVQHACTDAAEQGAQLVCFPETCLLGWVNPWAHHRADPIPGDTTRHLGEFARQFNLHLCIGLEERSEDQTFDSSVLIDPTGTVLTTHRKINLLSPLMTPSYTPGTSVSVTDTPCGNIGMLICADTFVESILHEMKALSPDWLLVPFGWAEREEMWPQHGEKLHATIRHVATSVGCPVIGVNSVGAITHGPWAGRVFGGQSLAVDARGETLALARDRDHDVVVVDLP